MSKLLYKLAFIIGVFISFPCFSTHETIINEIREQAAKSFQTLSIKEAYEKATNYKNGKGEFPQHSLHAILHAERGYSRVLESTATNQSEQEVRIKALHNLAMIQLALGDVPRGRTHLGQAGGLRFAASVNNYKIVEGALNKFSVNPFTECSALPSHLQKDYPYGVLHKDYAEEVYKELLSKGVNKIVLTQEEAQLFKFTEDELKELETLTKHIEDIAMKVEDPCIILLGRSPLFAGKMLEARKQFKGPIINIPFSGPNSLKDIADSKNKIDKYRAFLSKQLPQANNYLVVDCWQTGESFNRFGELLKDRIPPQNLHVLAIPMETPQNKIKEIKVSSAFGHVNALPSCPNLLLRTASKALFTRENLLPGIGFYPRNWADDKSLEEAREFDFLKPSTKPVVKLHWQQIEEWAAKASD